MGGVTVHEEFVLRRVNEVAADGHRKEMGKRSCLERRVRCGEPLATCGRGEGRGSLPRPQGRKGARLTPQEGMRINGGEETPPPGESGDWHIHH